MEEIWKDIQGYEDKYQVSNKGNIKSFYSGKILKPQNSYGYNRVNLCKNGKGKHKSIHSLVLEAFTHKRENGEEINHIDGNKKNNNLDNLEWCTSKENTVHALKTGLMKKGEKHYLSKLKNTQVIEIKRIYAQGKISQRKLAKKFNVTQKVIYNIVNNKTRKDLKENELSNQ